MLKINSKLLGIRSLVMIALCTTLFSFSEKVGGDSYTIYLNDKLLLQHYVSREGSAKSIQLNEATSKDELKIHYSHCGKMGTARNISIKDVQNKVLKSWQFPDSPDGAASAMTCKVKDILALQKSNGGRVNLFYSSKELSDGRLLVAIVSTDNTKASLK